MRLPIASYVSLILLAAAPPLAAASPKYRVVKQVKLSGDTGWDYLTLDHGSKRLFVTRGTFVSVLSLETLEEIGKIPDTEGVHGVALAEPEGKGFASDGKANTVTVFDLKTLAVTGRITTGTKPDAILYEPVSHRVLAMNGGSHSATVIDAAKGAVIGTIPLDGKPESAVSDGAGRVFVNLEDKSKIAVLDSAKLKKLDEWSLSPCEGPSGLAIDREHHRLFAGCDNELMAIVDSTNGKLVAHAKIGKGVDATAFDAGTQLAFSSNGEGTLTVVHEDSPDKFTVVDNARTQKSARTMALDPVTHRIYSVAAELEPKKPGERRPTLKPGTVKLLVLDRE